MEKASRVGYARSATLRGKSCAPQPSRFAQRAHFPVRDPDENSGPLLPSQVALHFAAHRRDQIRRPDRVHTLLLCRRCPQRRAQETVVHRKLDTPHWLPQNQPRDLLAGSDLVYVYLCAREGRYQLAIRAESEQCSRILVCVARRFPVANTAPLSTIRASCKNLPPGPEGQTSAIMWRLPVTVYSSAAGQGT